MPSHLPIGQGKDAQQRRLQKDQERRDKAAESRRLYGEDLGELEPCAWCGAGHRPNFCADPGEHLDPLYRWHWSQPVYGGASINPEQRRSRTRKDERCLVLARRPGAMALVGFEDRTRALVPSRGLRAIRSPDASHGAEHGRRTDACQLARPPPAAQRHRSRAATNEQKPNRKQQRRRISV